MHPCTIRRSHRHRRRGSSYVFFMGTAMVVTILGLSALMAVRIQRWGAEGSNDLAAARFYAQSAIEHGFAKINQDPAWRTVLGTGFWFTDQPMRRGTYSLEAIFIDDGDGKPENDDVVLTGTGVSAQATHKVQVRLLAQIRGLSCLEVALDAGGDLTFSSTLTCNQTVSTNGSILASTATGTSDLEAVGTIDPGGIGGGQTTGITPRTMPDPSTVFDFYADSLNGTAIDINAIPTSGGIPTISDVVISPASNPYGGPLNAKGIYVINCAGIDITISTSRIVGTLVLLNPGPNSQIHTAVNWEPAVVNYPALLVSGGMSINFDSAPLQESSLAGNFNPPGTPYNGVEDTDTTDSYPSVIKGLVYVSGAVTIPSSSNPVFDGVLLSGAGLTADGNLNLTYQATYFNNPPPGFAAPVQMIVSPGSWQRVIN